MGDTSTRRTDMQYVMLIHQGDTPTPFD